MLALMATPTPTLVATISDDDIHTDVVMTFHGAIPHAVPTRNAVGMVPLTVGVGVAMRVGEGKS